MSIIPTWPITKILWIKKHEPSIFSKVWKYLLLKDFIQYKLTGKIFGEYSIYNFSLYFDIHNKWFWQDILDYCQLNSSQLPTLVEPCTNIGSITSKAAGELGLSPDTSVNVGTLDHFAAMIGTGNIESGIISESTGTVLSIATMIDADKVSVAKGVPYHCGPFKDSFVLLSVCESGGVSLQWYKDTFLKGVSFNELGNVLQNRKRPSEITFLPYLVGVNAPDYDKKNNGVFYGLKLQHDEYDLALAVMEGVAHMLALNIEFLKELGLDVNRIISTGGGSRSLVWSQIKADITGCDIVIPANAEVACLGAAIIGALNIGIFKSYQEAVDKKVTISQNIKPAKSAEYQQRHHLFNQLRYSLKNIDR
jgi:xylulokinase